MRDLERPGRSPSHAPNGMVATSHMLSSQVALDVLQRGGNAMDAAIAACATQCVVEPGSTGIGGDNFCIYAPGGEESEIVAFNGSGKAGADYNLGYFQDQGIEEIGRDVHSVSIPGAIDAWFRLHQTHGKMSWGELFQPAIAYARDGYPISNRIHRDLNAEHELLAATPSAAEALLQDGKVPAVGARHAQPKLASTLKRIAEEGRDGFYAGPVADDIVSYLQSLGGLQTVDDMKNTQGIFVTPISGAFRDLTIWECPPNGQGVIALLLMKAMQKLDVDRDAGPIELERIHREIEACRMAYQARNLYLADPDFAPVPVEELLSDDYAQSIVDRIDPTRAQFPTPDMTLPKHKSTVYISIVDKDRNACSFINTLFYSFGSGLVAPESGVLLQNRAMGFTLEPGHPNVIEGGKRPLHTIIPGMATRDGKVQLSFGVMGGHYQAMGQTQFLTRYVDYGLDIQEAMDRPRFMPDPFDGTVEFEGAIPDDIRAELIARGHDLVAPRAPVGGSQAIAIDWENGILTGGSDPRKDGCAIGY